MTDTGLIAQADAGPMFLIEKRGLYYRPDSAGYTGIKDEAGRYSADEAAAICGPNGPDGPRDGIEIWTEADAPDYSPACFSDVRLRHQFEKATEELDALRDALATERARVVALEAERDRLREVCASASRRLHDKMYRTAHKILSEAAALTGEPQP